MTVSTRPSYGAHPFKGWKAHKSVYSIGCLIVALFAETCRADEDVFSADLFRIPLCATYFSTLGTIGTIVFTSDDLPALFSQYGYAKEDAAAFVASDGNIHGVQLERAWRSYLVSDHEPKLKQSAFAEEVLVWN
ncbi:DUF2388 domain-containing protein [Pseudomonas chlororaphis]|uniref:DUF2388 domain-containing protein n=1 Tax=Pseudomonas chlororaphis TaxID=587753 RepID=UPI0039DFC6F0